MRNYLKNRRDENVHAMTEERIEEVFVFCCSETVLDHLDVFVESTTSEEEDR